MTSGTRVTRETTSREHASLDNSPEARSLSGSPRIEFLDVVRGLAALCVVVQHAFEQESLTFAHWTNRYVNLGELGVVAFFIVSGFIIPVSMEKYNSLSRFWLGRLLRLWPLYILSLFCVLAVYVCTRDIPDYIHSHPLLFVIGNLTMFQEFLQVPLALGAYWTLSLELVFYVLCSFLFVSRVLKRARLWVAVSGAALVLSQSIVAVVAHRSLPAGRIGLLVTAFFGTLLYREAHRRYSARFVFTTATALLASFALCFWIRFEWYPAKHVITPGSPLPVSGMGTILSWTSAYTLFLALYYMRSRRFPRLFIWMGQISYPLYLFHGLVMMLVPSSFPPQIMLPVVIGGSLGLAHLMHISVENPVGRFQHAWLRQRRPALVS